MIPDNRFGATVIARNERFRVSKLDRHGLTFDGAIQVSEPSFHICYTLAADRTSIGCLRILTIAFLVNAMPAPHKNNCLWRRKHVIPTNGAVALRRFLDTSMSCLNRDWHTYATSLRLIIRKDSRSVLKVTDPPYNEKNLYQVLCRYDRYHSRCSGICF
jgi:hypothetical protein